MKKLIFIMFSVTIIGCNQYHKKKDLLGTWEMASAYDIETGKLRLPESDDLVFVEFKSDSLYLTDLSTVDVHPWRIEGDFLFIGNWEGIYIKELTKNKLIVEYDFLGITQLTLKKRN